MCLSKEVYLVLARVHAARSDCMQHWLPEMRSGVVYQRDTCPLTPTKPLAG